MILGQDFYSRDSSACHRRDDTTKVMYAKSYKQLAYALAHDLSLRVLAFLTSKRIHSLKFGRRMHG